MHYEFKFEECFLHGNLELVYPLKEIKNTKIKDILTAVLEIKKFSSEKITTSFIWRMYKNISTILNSKELTIVNNPQEFKDLLKILKTFKDIIEDIVTIEKYDILEKIKKKEHDVESAFFVYKITYLCIINDIKEKIYLYDEDIDNSIEEYFAHMFTSEIEYVKKNIIMCDYITPFEDMKWTSKWKFIINDISIRLNSIDVYLDSYFYNTNVSFNSSMKNDINKIVERIEYLKANADEYYDYAIKPKIKATTTTIFREFPYQIIYKDYRNLINVDKNVFVPSLFRQINITTKNNENNHLWALSVIPFYISCYFLGFPIISSDVPNEKNVIYFIGECNNFYFQEYIKKIIKLNKQRLQCSSFEIPCGNGLENDDFVDLTINKIIDYNMDDTLLLFNEGVYHCFTSQEFIELCKRESNPYNRGKITVFNHILENLRFKKKIKRILSKGGINIEVNKTLVENFEDLMGALENNFLEEENNFGNYELFNNPIFNFLVNSLGD